MNKSRADEMMDSRRMQGTPVVNTQPAGWPVPEMRRLSSCLGRLLPHVRRDDVAITGGIAIDLGLAALGRPGGRTSIADLDLVTSRMDAVAASVSEQFLVSHYHVPEPGAPKFMIQLVDPLSRIRIDIFPDLAGSLEHAAKFTIGEHTVKVLSLRSILDHKLLTISKASQSKPIDPKHDDDARALGAILGREVPPAPSGSLVKDVYGGEADLACRRCEVSRNPGFPLAPKDQIFALLGWTHEQAQQTSTAVGGDSGMSRVAFPRGGES